MQAAENPYMAVIAPVLAECHASLDAGTAAAPSTSSVCTAAGGSSAGVSEADVISLKSQLSTTKHELLELQTKRNLASSLTAADPFAALDENAPQAQATHAALKSEIKAVKATIEQGRTRIAALSDGLAAAAVAAAGAQKKLAAVTRVLDAIAEAGLPPTRVTVVHEGGEVVVESEAQARSLLSDFAVKTAERRATAMVVSKETLRLQERQRQVDAEAAALEEALAAARAARATRAHIAKTEADKLNETAATYQAMAATLAAVLAYDAPAAPAAAAPAIMDADADAGEIGRAHV